MFSVLSQCKTRPQSVTPPFSLPPSLNTSSPRQTTQHKPCSPTHFLKSKGALDKKKKFPRVTHRSTPTPTKSAQPDIFIFSSPQPMPKTVMPPSPSQPPHQTCNVPSLSRPPQAHPLHGNPLVANMRTKYFSRHGTARRRREKVAHFPPKQDSTKNKSSAS